MIPPSVRTTTSRTPAAPAGAVIARIVVGLTTTRLVGASPPTVTVAPGWKFVPVMVIDVPPASGPAVGVTRVIVGLGRASNVAWQARAAVRVTVPSLQSASPLQPANREPVAAVAVRVTTVPAAYDSAQSAPQAMPAGLLVTVPLPVPALVTVSG